MKKQSIFCALVTIIIGMISPILSSAQTDKFPFSQIYFDNTIGKECAGFWGLDKIISQKITDNTIIVIIESTIEGHTGVPSKSIYSNLDFSKLSRITTYKDDWGTKKIMCITFWFNYDITYTLYEDDIEYATGKQATFECYILAKDEEEIKSLINGWLK